MKIIKSQNTSVLIGFENDLFKNCEYVGLNYSNKETNATIIYKIFIPDYIEILDALSHFLDSKETERAKRYHKEKDKSRFIICRSLLKVVLSIHTQANISEINLDYHKNKKPYLSSHPSTYFNVSHSQDYGLIAISNSLVGIDIEFINPDYDFMNGLEFICNFEELTFIKNAHDKKHAFYSLWTRKESFVKAIGKGIDDDFYNISSLVGLHPLDTSILETNKNWNIQGFEINRNYMGAIAYEENSTFSDNLKAYHLPNQLDELMALLPN
ncbi:MAG: 4'-phosphopantetheinyl transferase superfamily protein [Flaviramulus sp.]|nr:4'-phosphopantetheinyl transferase superfamily protein [Flaviramulus sp.]